jgi:cobalt-zinc-cadmium efflux system outer membrane protein
MKSLKVGLGITCLLISISSCATVQTDQEWDRLQTDVQKRLGEMLHWEQEEKDKAAIIEKVDELLTNKLTREEAVQIALINNRDLQHTLEEIGIAKSDLIQAGLIHNPSLSAFFRLPTGGGGTNTEADGLISISDIWQIPFRKKVASANLEMTMLKVQQAVLDTARKAKQAYDSLYYLGHARTNMKQLLEKIKEISSEVQRRRDFGFLTELDIYLAQIVETETEIALHQVESAHFQAKAHHDRVLGLGPDHVAYELAEESTDQLPEIPNVEQALAYAFNQRLDIQIEQLRIAEAERKLQLEKTRILKEVSIGVSYEREVEGDEVIGPGIDIQLPIFDQNQAQIAKSRFMLRRARRKLQALEGRVREEIIKDVDRINLQHKRCRLLKEKIIPLRKDALTYAEKWVGAMQLNRLYLLETQKGLLESELEYLEAKRELSRALWDLELHLGGRLPKSYYPSN